jgi:hypothetical protein
LFNEALVGGLGIVHSRWERILGRETVLWHEGGHPGARRDLSDEVSIRSKRVV